MTDERHDRPPTGRGRLRSFLDRHRLIRPPAAGTRADVAAYRAAYRDHLNSEPDSPAEAVADARLAEAELRVSRRQSFYAENTEARACASAPAKPAPTIRERTPRP